MGKDRNGKKLPNGISQLKGGSYRGTVMYHGIKKQVCSASLAECKRKLDEARYTLTHCTLVEPSKMTVKAYADTFIAYKSKVVKNGTMRSYSDMLNRYIIPSFGNYRLVDVRKDFLRQWIFKIAEDKASSTTKLIWAVASALFSQAYCDNYITVNPCDGIKLPRSVGATKTATFEDKEQVETFLSNLSVVKDSTFSAMVRFTMLTGLRSGEVRALKWCNVDLHNRTVEVKHTLLADGTLDTPKTDNSHRLVPLSDEAVSLLNALRSDLRLVSISGDNFIFCDGEVPYSASKVAYLMNRVVIACGRCFPNITMHSLRHYFATTCANNGMTPKVLMSIMGHANIAITMDLYAHKDDAINRSEMDAVAACL